MNAPALDPYTDITGTDDPAAMTPHQRLLELAAVLAMALLRAQTPPEDAAEPEPDPLEPRRMPDVDDSPAVDAAENGVTP